MTKEDQIRQARAEKQALEKLIENPEFVRFMGELAGAYEEAASAHEDPAKTPDERAEWLYAMKKLRVLKDRPNDRLKSLKSYLASLGAVE